MTMNIDAFIDTESLGPGSYTEEKSTEFKVPHVKPVRLLWAMYNVLHTG